MRVSVDDKRAERIEWLVNSGRVTDSDVRDLLADRAKMVAYVREQPCECVDEYMHDKPGPCDRCVVLGEDHRWAAEATKENS